MPDADPNREGLPAHVVLLSPVPKLTDLSFAREASDDLGAGVEHPLECAHTRARLPIHRTDPVAQHRDREAELTSIRHRLHHAEVGGEPADDDPSDAALRKEAVEHRGCRVPTARVADAERAVAVFP